MALVNGEINESINCLQHRRRNRDLVSPRMAPIKVRTFQTWTFAELSIGLYLVEWAIARIPARTRRQEKQRNAYLKTRTKMLSEIEQRRQRFVDRWLACQPLPPPEQGFRVHALTRILHRIIERQAF